MWNFGKMNVDDRYNVGEFLVDSVNNKEIIKNLKFVKRITDPETHKQIRYDMIECIAYYNSITPVDTDIIERIVNRICYVFK